MDPRLPSLVALNGRIAPSLSSFILSGRLREVMLATQGRGRSMRREHDFPQPAGKDERSHARDAWTVRGLALGSVVNPTALFRDTSARLLWWVLCAAELRVRA